MLKKPNFFAMIKGKRELLLAFVVLNFREIPMMWTLKYGRK